MSHFYYCHAVDLTRKEAKQVLDGLPIEKLPRQTCPKCQTVYMYKMSLQSHLIFSETCSTRPRPR